MKKHAIIITMMLQTVFIIAKAQIPNNGFENWINKGTYMEPDGYLTSNSSASTSFYPVTRSTDHYPSGIGNYSIRIESNISLLPNYDAFGIALQNVSDSILNGPGPAFPLNGHPTKLTGYYKYAPLGDTMMILITLYDNGSEVVSEEFLVSSPVSTWTSFDIEFPPYISADSGSIMLSTYLANGTPPEFVPRGNSVLFVDNLNFDSLITGLPGVDEKPEFSMYPNPAINELNILHGNISQQLHTVILNTSGQEVFVQNINMRTGSAKIDISSLKPGLYAVKLQADDQSRYQTRIIISR